MNPITLAMDGLLAGLLLLALVLGMRLNGRLKALRESHLGFAKAVSELDAAAAKADAALRALHSASENTHDDLLARIETARSLITRLENAADTAEKSARRAEAAAALRPSEPVLHNPPPTPAAAPRRALSDLLATYNTRETRETREAAPPVAEPTPAMRGAPVLRRRPTADEELFADADAGARPTRAGLKRMSPELHPGKAAR